MSKLTNPSTEPNREEEPGGDSFAELGSDQDLLDLYEASPRSTSFDITSSTDPEMSQGPLLELLDSEDVITAQKAAEKLGQDLQEFAATYLQRDLEDYVKRWLEEWKKERKERTERIEAALRRKFHELLSRES
jgi:DNA-binding ferritin-like protein (Dps family)